MLIPIIIFILWGLNIILGLPWIVLSIQHLYSLFFLDQDNPHKAISITVGDFQIFSFASEKMGMYFLFVIANTMSIYSLRRIII